MGKAIPLLRTRSPLSVVVNSWRMLSPSSIFPPNGGQYSWIIENYYPVKIHINVNCFNHIYLLMPYLFLDYEQRKQFSMCFFRSDILTKIPAVEGILKSFVICEMEYKLRLVTLNGTSADPCHGP